MTLGTALKKLACGFVACPMFLAACASEPRIDATRLAGRSHVRIDARIAEQTLVNTGAIPRAQKAGADAAGGAAAGAAVWFQDPMGAAIAVSVPVVILATGAAGALAGGAYGAASGSSASQAEIDASVRVLSTAFRPALYERSFEENLARAFESRLKAASSTCVEARRERGKCRPGRERGDLNFRAGFQLAPPVTGGTTGAIDIVGVVTVWTDQRGLVEPNCISWRYRARAGELIDLATDGGEPLRARMSQVIPQMAKDLTDLILPVGRSMKSPQSGLQEGVSTPRRLSKGEYESLSTTRRGRRLIASGYYVLDDTPATDEPQRLNKVEYDAIGATRRGKRLIESGYYVLDEGKTPAAPKWKRSRAPSSQQAVSSKWTRQHCDFSALAVVASP